MVKVNPNNQKMLKLGKFKTQRERATYISHMRKQRKTLKEIGMAVGLSYTRVAQIMINRKFAYSQNVSRET